MSLDMLGAHTIGLDYGKLAGGLLTTAGDVAEGIKADEDAKKVTAAEKSKADAAITTDNAAALAKTAALVSAVLAAQTPAGKNKATADAKAQADQMALDSATTAMDTAGAAAPPNANALRVSAAQKALAAATAKLQAEPMNVYTQNLVKAWTWVLNKIQNVQIVKNAPDAGKGDGKGGKGGDSESFLSKKIIGPVKVWHAGAGVGVLGLGWLAFKKGLFRKLGIG